MRKNKLLDKSGKGWGNFEFEDFSSANRCDEYIRTAYYLNIDVVPLTTILLETRPCLRSHWLLLKRKRIKKHPFSPCVHTTPT